MAAGLTLLEVGFETFSLAFEQVAREQLQAAHLSSKLETDGTLLGEDLSLECAETLSTQVWGQGFPPPLFHDIFCVLQQRLVGNKHLKLQLKKQAHIVEAMLFNHTERLPERIRAVYQLVCNEWLGRKEVQLYVEHFEPATE